MSGEGMNSSTFFLLSNLKDTSYQCNILTNVRQRIRRMKDPFLCLPSLGRPLQNCPSLQK